MVLACRDLKRAQEACDKIMLETDSKTVYVERVDLASMESIREFAKNFKSKFNRLDILINNAGKLLKFFFILYKNLTINYTCFKV